jgi:hypothetical protein
MFGFGKRERDFNLEVKIDDSWSFKSSGKEDLVIGMFASWLDTIAGSHSEQATSREKPPVGFTSSKTREIEAETQLEESLDDDD